MPSPKRPQNHLRGRIIAIVGAAATALSLIIGFIAILPILTQNASGVDKLTVEIAPYRPDALTVFAVPRGTSLDGYPPGAVDAPCHADQRSWLAAHGTVVQAYYFVTIANRATSGNVLGFSNVLGAGESSTPAQGSVLIECDDAGPSTRIAPAKLDLSSGVPAYYDRSRMDDAGESPDTPVIYNLQPGESGQFVLLLVATQDFTGEVSYTATSGSDVAVRSIDLGGAVSMPGTGSRPGLVLANDPLWSSCSAEQTMGDCVGAR